MYKRQIYQIAESNLIKKNRFGSENRIESKLFCPNWNALIPMSLSKFTKYNMTVLCYVMLCRLSTARPDVTGQYCFCRWTMWMGQLLSVRSGLKFSVGDSSDIVENPIHTTDADATRKKVLSSLVGRCESGIIERFTDARLCVLFLSIWIYITNCRIFVFIIFLPGCV